MIFIYLKKTLFLSTITTIKINLAPFNISVHFTNKLKLELTILCEFKSRQQQNSSGSNDLFRDICIIICVHVSVWKTNLKKQLT